MYHTLAPKMDFVFYRSNFCTLPILIKVLLASDDLFCGDEKIIFSFPKVNYQTNKSYIDISNGQKFELLAYFDLTKYA